MTLFWIAGITINLVFLVAVAWWAVRNWRQNTQARRDRERGPR